MIGAYDGGGGNKFVRARATTYRSNVKIGRLSLICARLVGRPQIPQTPSALEGSCLGFREGGLSFVLRLLGLSDGGFDKLPPFILG